MVRYAKSVLTSVVLIGSLFASHNASATLISSSESFSTRTVAEIINASGPSRTSRTTETSTIFSGFDSSIGILESVSILYDTTIRIQGNITVVDPTTGFLEEGVVRGFGRAQNVSFINLFSPNLAGNNAQRNMETLISCFDDDDGECSRASENRFFDFDGILYSSTDQNVLQLFTDRNVGIRSTNFATAIVGNCTDIEDTCSVRATSIFSGRYTLNFVYRDFPQAVSSPGALSLMLLGVLVAGMRRKAS